MIRSPSSWVELNKTPLLSDSQQMSVPSLLWKKLTLNTSARAERRIQGKIDLAGLEIKR
jgi:hypothetical protein